MEQPVTPTPPLPMDPSLEPPSQCPGCKRTTFTWYRYETLGAMQGDKHCVACGDCGYVYLLDKRPEWGGLYIDPSGARVPRARKQGT